MRRVRIQLITLNMITRKTGKITGEPMSRTEAINTLFETYGVSTTSWQHTDSVSRTIGNYTWTWKLINA